MFDSIPPPETPIRPPSIRNDLLISFETPTTNPPQTQPPTTRKTLLDMNLDEVLMTPHSHNRTDTLSELFAQTLESERRKWVQEVETRHASDLENLAADLHAQYREKHTRKVEALKVTYKRQYDKKLGILEDKVRELEGVVEGLKGDLEREGREKRELIEMSEELMRLTGGGGNEN
jgi:Fungal Transforming acidic coiled-coil (TACC) proteins